MKYKTSKKQIRSMFNHVLKVRNGYLQHLLIFESPMAYTTHLDGWGSDIYDIGSVAISEGNAPFGDLEINNEVCKKYDKAANEILDNENLPFEDKEQKLKVLQQELIAEVVGH